MKLFLSSLSAQYEEPPIPIVGNKRYVRPSGGSYGREDGLDYDNAWNGEANIDWSELVDGVLVACNFVDGSIPILEPTATVIYTDTSGIPTMEIESTFVVT